MNSEENIVDISAELSEELFVDEAPLLAFRVIGCTFVTVLVGFTIIVYVTSGMTHTDCVAQISAEFCILAAYMLILLTTTEPSKINKNMCICIQFFLHICFLGAFFFGLLEVLCICQVLVPFFQKRAFLKTSHVSIFGWACPITVAGVATLVWMKEISSKSNCWVDFHKPLMWATIIPIGICIGLHAIFLLIVFCATDRTIFVPESQYNRAKSYLGTRWTSMIILITLTASWVCGVLAYNRKEEALYAGFTVASILLGVCIFTLRMSTDDEMRSIIISDLLCFLLPHNKVNSVTVTSYREKAEISHQRRNGTIPEEKRENESRRVTPHR